MKRILFLTLFLAACTPHLITPVPPLPSVAPSIAPAKVAVDAPLLPTVTPTPVQ